MYKLKHPWTQAFRCPAQWFVCILAVVMVGYTLMEPATALYALSTPEEDVLVLSTTSLQGSALNATQIYTSQTVQGGDIVLTAGETLVITYHGEEVTTQTKAETISQLLDRLGYSPSPLDLIVADFTDAQATVIVDSNFTYYEQAKEVSTYETQRIANPTLPEGTENIIQQGQDGESVNTYEVVYADGALLSRQLVGQTDSTVVDEIIEYGTAALDVGRNDPLVDVVTFEDGSGYLSFESGATLTFSGTKGMTATAYTGGVGKVGWITATGTYVHVGVIAVDKSVIPLGTKMFVVTDSGIVYGTGVAEDTGVIGNIVDLYYDTYDECINFGRRSCTVYFID
ncbi:G5 domain-containing protein [Bengtsoniella intestinalis]|uniref:G5 and 3D domain-containing protein n=1 Tax=Bengtsoniella intestinalis TaxID=3073143 RepID=UPI00391F32A6